MKKRYYSPEFEMVKLRLQECVLNTLSIDEQIATGGDIEDPDAGMEE